MKKIFKKYVIFLLLIASIIDFNIYMPISDNNILKITAIELFLPIMIAYYIVLFIRKKLELNVFYKKLCLSILLFFLWYGFIFIARFLMGYEFKQSLLAIKVSIFPLILLFFIHRLSIPKDHLIKNLLLFNFVLNVIQWGNCTNFRMSNFLGNIMVYLTLICMLFPINIYYLEQKESSIFYKIIGFFNTCSVLLIPLMAGSRSSFYISMCIFFILLMHTLATRKIQSLFLLILSFLVSFGGNYYFLNQTGVVSYSHRILPGFFEQRLNPDDNLNSFDDFEEIMDQEKDKSDNLRGELVQKSLESIKKSMIIGEGIIYFPVDTDYGVSLQSAHNFILEYINAYGLIGFLLYGIIHLIIIFELWKTTILKGSLIFLICAFISTFGHSFVQPTLLIVPVVVLFFFLYSLFLVREVPYGEKS